MTTHLPHVDNGTWSVHITDHQGAIVYLTISHLDRETITFHRPVAFITPEAILHAAKNLVRQIEPLEQQIAARTLRAQQLSDALGGIEVIHQ